MSLMLAPIPYNARYLEAHGTQWQRWPSVQICAVEDPVKEHLVVLQVDAETWIESGDKCSVEISLVRTIWGPALMLSLKLNGSWCQEHIFRTAGNPHSDLTSGFLKSLMKQDHLQIVAFGHRSKQAFGRWFLPIPESLRDAAPIILSELRGEESDSEAWSNTVESILGGSFGFVPDLSFIVK